jgi:predicted transcriptional regulator
MKNTSLRISDIEKQHLDEFCRITERTQSDVLRQYIRSLSVSGILNPIDRTAILPDTHPLV